MGRGACLALRPGLAVRAAWSVAEVRLREAPGPPAAGSLAESLRGAVLGPAAEFLGDREDLAPVECLTVYKCILHLKWLPQKPTAALRALPAA